MDLSKVEINLLTRKQQAEYQRLPDALPLEDIAELWKDDKDNRRTIEAALLKDIKERKLQVLTCENWEKGYSGLCIKDSEILDFEELLDRMSKRSAIDKDYKKEVMEKLMDGELHIPYIPTPHFIITNDANPLSKMDECNANQIIKIFTPDPLPAHIENLPRLSKINNLSIHKDDFKQWAINTEQWPIKNCLLSNWWPDEQIPLELKIDRKRAIQEKMGLVPTNEPNIQKLLYKPLESLFDNIDFGTELEPYFTLYVWQDKLINERDSLKPEDYQFREKYNEEMSKLNKKIDEIQIYINKPIEYFTSNECIRDELTEKASSNSKKGNTNTQPYSESRLVNTPKKQDDWFDLINDMATAFFNEYGNLPNCIQAWGQLCTNPPHGYAVTRGKDKGEECLNMPGCKSLALSAFKERWRKYTTE